MLPRPLVYSLDSIKDKLAWCRTLRMTLGESEGREFVQVE